jgi:general stress protein 26
MSDLTLDDLAKKMRHIDIAILTTKTADGELNARPMSNNGDVDYDGDSWFFTNDETAVVAEIERDPRVSLGFTGKHGFWASVEGDATLTKEKASFEEHWTKDLDAWFEQGVDTPGLTLIKVHANKIRYWNRNDQGEVTV